MLVGQMSKGNEEDFLAFAMIHLQEVAGNDARREQEFVYAG
jgi:hypothetical protein